MSCAPSAPPAFLEAAGEGIGDDGERRGAHDRALAGLRQLRKSALLHDDDLAYLQHGARLRSKWWIAS
jgi:hypothetical protein